MTTTNSHAAPWTLRRFLACITGAPTTRTKPIPGVMSGREATARHLFGEYVQWSRLDMLEYDANPYLQEAYLREADRRIAGGVKVELPELLVLRHWGYTPEQWAALRTDVRTAKRSGYYEAKGLGA